jgi:hypothetical protein
MEHGTEIPARGSQFQRALAPENAQLITKRHIALAGVGFAGLVGCSAQIGEVEYEAPQLDEFETVMSSQAMTTGNGLSSINGLSSANGLSSVNGLSSANGLSSVNGLRDGVGLMASSSGRATLSYLIKCALPAGKRITKKDQNGNSHTFSGSVGVAPAWENGACNDQCQRWISACMLAHVNATGTSLPIWFVADPSRQPQIGWSRSSTYPNQEGSFFGNLFTNPPQAFYCGGRNFNAAAVSGRIGAGSSGGPYRNPWGSDACDDHCSRSDHPYNQSGYKVCNGNDAVVTVWRRASY